MSRSLLVLSLAAVLAGPVLAQAPAEADRAAAPVHRLEIRDGVVYHDGVALPPSAVPDGVNLHGFPPAAMDYSGDAIPVIEVDGRVLAFKDNRLVEVEDVVGGSRKSQAYAIWQTRALTPTAEANVPREEVAAKNAEQAYMESLSERDRALYERLVRERDMENEALRLAQRYHRTQDEAEREALRSQLRDKLGAMFDLKQENRQEEVRQMEEALDALRSRISERAEMRERIVEYRLNELIGQ